MGNYWKVYGKGFVIDDESCAWLEDLTDVYKLKLTENGKMIYLIQKSEVMYIEAVQK